jgi:hypothetical protein
MPIISNDHTAIADAERITAILDAYLDFHNHFIPRDELPLTHDELRDEIDLAYSSFEHLDDHEHAFKLHFHFDTCQIDIIAFFNDATANHRLRDFASAMISADISEYRPMIILDTDR